MNFGRSTHHHRHGRKLLIDYGNTEGQIVNNGHTIEVETEGNNALTLDGTAYELVQWIVMTDPVTVSDEDMAQFAERIHFNARFAQRQPR